MTSWWPDHDKLMTSWFRFNAESAKSTHLLSQLVIKWSSNGHQLVIKFQHGIIKRSPTGSAERREIDMTTLCSTWGQSCRFLPLSPLSCAWEAQDQFLQELKKSKEAISVWDWVNSDYSDDWGTTDYLVLSAANVDLKSCRYRYNFIFHE